MYVGNMQSLARGTSVGKLVVLWLMLHIHNNTLVRLPGTHFLSCTIQYSMRIVTHFQA